VKLGLALRILEEGVYLNKQADHILPDRLHFDGECTFVGWHLPADEENDPWMRWASLSNVRRIGKREGA